MRLKPTGDVEINVGVLVNSNEVLWEFRDFLVKLEAEEEYKISMMLAKDQDTILRVMSFIPGGFDIVVVAEPLPGIAYTTFADKVSKYNADLRILCQSNIEMELSYGLPPHIFLVSTRDKIKELIKGQIDSLIAEKIEKEKSNE